MCVCVVATTNAMSFGNGATEALIPTKASFFLLSQEKLISISIKLEN